MKGGPAYQTLLLTLFLEKYREIFSNLMFSTIDSVVFFIHIQAILIEIKLGLIDWCASSPECSK